MASYLLSHRGTIEGVDDEFVHTLVVTGAGGSVQEVAETARDLWAPIVTDPSTGLALYMNERVTYTEVAAAEIISLAEGNLSAAFHATYPSGSAPAGDSPGTTPAQSACAVSLTAGVRANGVPLKGRFYLPVINPGTGGLFPEGTRSLIGGAILDYVQALAAEGLDAGVWSRSTATFSTLTMIRVGDRPDTIRTRRNSGPEEYTEFAV